MIAKMIGTNSQLMGGSSLVAGHEQTMAYSLAVFKYVAGMELDERDHDLLEELSRIANYPMDEKGDPERIVDREAFKVNGESWDEVASAFAYTTARYGKRALKHIAVSYRPGQVTPTMARRHCETFLRILGAENCAGIYALHGDTPHHPHWHLALCAYDLTEHNLAQWGQGFEREALHLALAKCEFDDRLAREPNGRYVFDETGGYHLVSGLKVADAEGRIINRGRMKCIPGLQFECEQKIRATEGIEPGDPVPADLTLEIFAKAAAKERKTWDELHRAGARLGVRIEPYSAAGKIKGVHFIADTEDGEVVLNASAIHKGHDKLVEQFKGVPFEPRADDVWVRPFQCLGYVDAVTDEEGSEEREKQRRVAEEASVAALEAELKMRHRTDGRSGMAAEKARTAKKRKRDGFTPGQSDETCDNEDASYREAEREMVRGLKRAVKAEWGPQRGRASNADPAEGVFWGTRPSDIERDPPRDLDRYDNVFSHGVRRYFEGETLVFEETRNFVTLRSTNPRHQLDALRLAQKKFGTIKIEASRTQRRKLIAVAVEHGVKLDSSHDLEVAALAKKSAATAKSKKLAEEVKEATSRESAQPIQPEAPSQPTSGPATVFGSRRREGKPDPAAQIRAQAKQDRRDREIRVRHFRFPSRKPGEGVGSMSDIESRSKERSRVVRARKLLERMDRSRLLLASSDVRNPEGLRFLDDQDVQKAFARDLPALAWPTTQTSLLAIHRVQTQQRRWIAHAIATGTAKVENGELITDDRSAWAREFYAGQKPDPQFQELIEEARRKPHDAACDLRVRPEFHAWREARAEGDDPLAHHIAHEMERGIDRETSRRFPSGGPERNQEYRSLMREITLGSSNDEREALRETVAIGTDAYPDFRWSQALLSRGSRSCGTRQQRVRETGKAR